MPYMPDAPVTPDTDPLRMMPVPPGFPPRRTEEAPPLDDKQSRFVNGYSFYIEDASFSMRFARIFSRQSPAVVFLLQASWSTLIALLNSALFLFVIILKPEQKPVIAGMGKSSVGHYVLAGIIILVFALALRYSWTHGKQGRKIRWARYSWNDFEQFARLEVRIQYIGITEFIAMVGGLLYLIGAALRGYI